MTDYTCCPELIPQTITDWLNREVTTEELRLALDALAEIMEKDEQDD
jgi:hypothetical protein